MISDSQYVYLDVCTLCRRFDDQTQMRIRLETEAIQLILSHIESGELQMVISPVHTVEIDAITTLSEREHLSLILRQLGKNHPFDLTEVRKRAEYLNAQRLGPADAAHLAFAEAANADFVTCDDRLLRQCRRVKTHVWTGSPIAFCEKENLR